MCDCRRILLIWSRRNTSVIASCVSRATWCRGQRFTGSRLVGIEVSAPSWHGKASIGACDHMPSLVMTTLLSYFADSFTKIQASA